MNSLTMNQNMRQGRAGLAVKKARSENTFPWCHLVCESCTTSNFSTASVAMSLWPFLPQYSKYMGTFRNILLNLLFIGISLEKEWSQNLKSFAKKTHSLCIFTISLQF